MRPITFYTYCIFLSWTLSVQSHSALAEADTLLAEVNFIQQDAELLSEAIVAGKERALLCGSCHGKNGNSVRDYIPNLASQNAAYLFNQFEKFSNGERKDYVMSRLAKNLTRQDRINIALYFSQMSVETRVQPVASSAEGEAVYKGLCFACHEQDGYGNGDYPRIAGQPYEYLKRTLSSFSGGNDRRKNSPMVEIIKSLNKQQLLEVAAYVASMP